MAHPYMELAFEAARKNRVCEGCPKVLKIFERVQKYSEWEEARTADMSDTRGTDGLRAGAQRAIQGINLIGKLTTKRPCEGVNQEGLCEADNRTLHLAKLIVAGEIDAANELAILDDLPIRIVD